MLNRPPANFGLTVCEETVNIRRYNTCIKLEKCRCGVCFHYFSQRVGRIWNALPDIIVDAKSVDIFKHDINRFDLNKYLIFQND